MVSSTWIRPEIGAKLAKRVAVPELTPREKEVLPAVSVGKSNKEIGVARDISESTGMQEAVIASSIDDPEVLVSSGKLQNLFRGGKLDQCCVALPGSQADDVARVVSSAFLPWRTSPEGSGQ